MEGAILNLLSKLSSPIQYGFGLLWGMEKELEKLKSNLLAIRGVLHDAELRQAKEMAVRDWLQKLKDVAYDADDLVDAFTVQALRREVEIRDGMLKKVHNFFSPKNPLKFRFDMAHKMQELRERLDEIAKQKNNFHFNVEVVQTQPPSSSTRETYSLSESESEVYGRDDEKARIIDSLINSGEDEVLSVISIVGMGGLGKTTLAQLVYNDKSVAAHFDLRMWVYVSKDFDVGRLVKQILESAINNRSDPLSLDLLQTRLREKLSGKRYLLVLDDVWNGVHEKWDKLKRVLKCCAQGSKIIVTTRSNTVASIMGTIPAYDLATLSENDSWSLFEKLAHPDPMLVSIGKEMVGKCDGLPLAVKTLGGLMSYKKSESEWLSVKNSESWKSQNTDGGILPILQLSYDHLTPHLKQCFAYCAIFRKGFDIDKDKLIKQWVAQGFIQFGDGDENKLSEEKGEDYFNDLLSRSLFQVAWKDDKDNARAYKMHDLIHDLLRFIVGTESFITEEISKQIVPKETRHLSLRDHKWVKESKNLKARVKCKKLHSMFLYGSIDVNVCSHFRCLKVLDLSSTSIWYLPNSLGKLEHLRYLDISHAHITKLPETICNLHSLQALILYRTHLRKLPKDIKRMSSLRHIELVYLPELPMPNGIGELTCLQTLQNFTVSQEGAGIEELKCLNQLRGQLNIRRLNYVRNENCAREARLMEKQQLRSLSLSWFDNETITDTRVNSETVIENLKPHSNLKELSIKKYMGLNFPSWIEKLTNLVNISLGSCINCEHLPPLGRLPFLEELTMSDMESMKYIFVFDGAYHDKDTFPSLKKLKLSLMPRLEGWWPHQLDNAERQEERHEQVLLGCLQSLEIIKCPKLTRLPRLLFSPALERLKLDNVGCDRIEMVTSQFLKVVELLNMQHLEELSLQQAHGLEELHVLNCPRMIHLPRLLPSLKRLKIYQCNEMLLKFVGNYFLLDDLSIEGFPQVKYLQGEVRRNNASLPGSEIDDPKPVSLLNTLKNLSNLKSLIISNFPDLMLLPNELQCLVSLESLSISNSCFKQTSISGVLPSLRILKLRSCQNLESLYCDGLQKLTCIQSYGCPKLRPFSSNWVRSLTSLDIASIEGADSFLESFENLTSLRSLDISSSPDLIALPESIGNLKSLDHLRIYDCIALESLPDSIGNLTLLTYLEINSSNAMRFFPNSVGNLISLKELNISRCPEMNALPESIGNLTSLVNLKIFRLSVLTALPESIGNLKSLNYLRIEDCRAMRSLPKSMGNLISLEDLSIEDCPEIETLPMGLEGLTNLQTLNINNCPLLKRRLLKKKMIKKRRKGKDWHKVSHVPGITIDGINPRAYFRGKEEKQ